MSSRQANKHEQCRLVAFAACEIELAPIGGEKSIAELRALSNPLDEPSRASNLISKPDQQFAFVLANQLNYASRIN